MLDQTKLAREFARLIREQFDTETLQEIVRRNALSEYFEMGCCATHDFVDANCVMSRAFVNVMGRYSQVDCNDDAALWSNAWDMAKASNFSL